MKLDRYQELFNRSEDPNLIIVGERFVDCNLATIKMLDYKSKQNLLNTHPSQLSPERQPDGQLSHAKANEMMAIAFANGSHRFEWNHMRANREVFPVEVLLTSIPEGNERTLHVIWRDISERKRTEKEKERLEEQLRQAHKMEAVGTMAGGIAHDFNNILAIILGNAEMAIDDIPPGNPANHNINEILEAANRAKNLIRQILAFSRKEKKELTPIRSQSLIKETLKLLRSTTSTTVSIAQKICQDCGSIMANPTQFHQLIMNLFANAVDAMDEKGEMTVSLQEANVTSNDIKQFSRSAPFSNMMPGVYVKLSITDTGTGMDKEIIERIFDPFFTTKDVGKGTGMGLSVVHGIVESHSGFVIVESEVGKGSTFNVFFPVTEAEEVDEIDTATHLQAGTERILLVDDEGSILKIAQRMLEGLGYKVVTEINSVKALEIFRANPDQFDLIITDQSMPNMSGSELVDEILKIRSDIPIILCSGFSSKVSKENAREKGISKYISKPYTKKLLAEIIREVLDKNPGFLHR